MHKYVFVCRLLLFIFKFVTFIINLYKRTNYLILGNKRFDGSIIDEQPYALLNLQAHFVHTK